MMRVAIVDDERLAVLRIQQILEGREDIEVVGAFTKYTELLQEFTRLSPDAVFLDIDMPGMNGLELAASLLEIDEHLEIVFITAYDQFALEAFRVNAVDYLLKPVDEGSLGQTIKRIHRRRGRTHTGPNISNLKPQIECFGHFHVHPSSGTGPVSFPTAKAEELLAFFLIHRGTNVSKWVICDSLWPEHEPHKAEQNLHTTVFRMKKTLLENGLSIQLTSQKGHYYFQLFEECDYIRFKELEREWTAQLAGRASETERILGHYARPLFGYKDYPWCEAAREQADLSFRKISKALASSYMEAGEYRPAYDFLSFVLSVVPYDEEAHEMILRIYLHWKDKAAFYKHYDKMKAALQQESGVEPPALLESLLQENMKES